MFIDIKFSFCKFLFIEQRHSELVLAIGIYLLWSFRDSFSNFNIIISYKDENTSKGILRVMYGMYEGGSFMGKGFGIWLSVRILWKPLSEDFFSPFCPIISESFFTKSCSKAWRVNECRQVFRQPWVDKEKYYVKRWGVSMHSVFSKLISL